MPWALVRLTLAPLCRRRVEVQMSPSTVAAPGGPATNIHDPEYVRALAESTDLSLLITKDKHWEAAALRCRLYPHEAR